MARKVARGRVSLPEKTHSFRAFQMFQRMALMTDESALAGVLSDSLGIVQSSQKELRLSPTIEGITGEAYGCLPRPQ
jgi:hypothetical protein